MGWLKKIIDSGAVKRLLDNAQQNSSPAPEAQDVVIAYTPEGATANEQLANLQKVTPVQMAAPEGPDPSTYRYYSGNLGEVGFGQVNPALYGEAKMMSYINPVSGQYFNTATPLPEDIVPEGWQALDKGMWPDRAEYIPGLMKGEGKQASMAPAAQLLAMQRGESFTQPSAPSTTQAPTALPPAPGFRPRVLQDMPQDARFMDMIRKYADKEFMPALPTLNLNQLGKPQQYADGGAVAPTPMTQQQLDDYIVRTGRFGGGTGNYSGPMPLASSNYLDENDVLRALPSAMSTTPGATPGGLIPSSTPVTQDQMQTIISDLTSVPSSTLKPKITPDMTIGQDITPLPSIISDLVKTPATSPSLSVTPMPSGSFDVATNAKQAAGSLPLNTYMKDLGYGRYTGNPTDLGFKERQCGPMGCAAFQVMGNVYNPSTGQYFEVSAGNPYETMPEGWKYTMGDVKERATGTYRNPQEAVIVPADPARPPVSTFPRGQEARTVPVREEGRRYGFDRSQVPAQRKRFVPQGPSDTGRAELMEFLKKNRMGV